VADGFASVPGGHFRWGVDHRPMLLIYDLDYGEQAACFYGGGGEGAVMLDCGGSRSFRYRVAPSLKRLGIAPDSAVLSHPDGGHLGGGMVMDEFPIQQVLMPVRRSRSGVYKGWLAEAPSHGVAVHHADELASVDFPDGAVLEILHAPDGSQPNARANERVAVFRMNWRGWRFLFLGDAGLETEYAMLDAGVDISADVLIAGKNRSDVSISDRLLEAVSPRVMVLSNDDFPAEEQRSSERLDYWRSIGVEVFDQAESGGVTLRVDESMLEVDGFVSGQSLQLTPR